MTAPIDAASGSSRHPAIVILDFGSQYSELIAPRGRGPGPLPAGRLQMHVRSGQSTESRVELGLIT